MLVGEINTCMAQQRYQTGGEPYNRLTIHELSDQARHFMPIRRYRAEGNWTWRMWREGGSISVKGDYILGMRCQDFYKMGIREPIMPTYQAPQILQGAVHLDHFGSKGGSGAGGRLTLQ